MNWYLAKIIFQIRIGGFSDTQFDVQQRLISATDAENALQKAKQIGAAEEEEFLNEKNETVSWSLAGVAAIEQLPALKDGIQLHSSTFESDDPSRFLHSIREAEAALPLPVFHT